MISACFICKMEIVLLSTEWGLSDLVEIKAWHLASSALYCYSFVCQVCIWHWISSFPSSGNVLSTYFNTVAYSLHVFIDHYFHFTDKSKPHMSYATKLRQQFRKSDSRVDIVLNNCTQCLIVLVHMKKFFQNKKVLPSHLPHTK